MFKVWQVLTLLLVFTAGEVSPQSFGKNKVLATKFNWQVIKTKHFTVHYDSSLTPFMPKVLEYLQQAYLSVTEDLGFSPNEPTPFFIYANHNDFEQTNIVDVGEGTGGVTEAFKNRFVIFNSGTEFWLEHVIKHEFTHVMQFNMLYGGFWKSARLLKSPLYPLWVMEGMAEYETGELDSTTEEMYLRDASISGLLYPIAELHGFSHVKPRQVTLAYKESAAVLKFLQEEYGKEKVPQLLQMLRDRFEIGSIIHDLTGLDPGGFDMKFREWMEDKYTIAAEGLSEPETYGTRLTKKDNLPQFNTNPVLSPDGKSFAYITDRNGPTELYLRNLDSGREWRLAGRQWGKLENIHTEGHALSFSPDGRFIAFCGEKEQKDYVYICDVRRMRLNKIVVPFSQVRSPVFHPDGGSLAVQGMTGGTNDLYLISRDGKVLRRLTHDQQDEDYPVFSPDGGFLVYSGEVIVPEAIPRQQRDLFALDLKNGSVWRVTNLPRSETYPVFTPDGKKLFFVSDRDGINDLYTINFNLEDEPSAPSVLKHESASPPVSGIRRLTRGIGGFFSPDISADGRILLCSVFRRGEMQVYKCDLENLMAGVEEIPLESSSLLVDKPSGQPSDTQKPALKSQPYHFRAGTDLFFPLFYYSTLDGLYVANFWQASEMLGNHNLQFALQYASRLRFLDYQFAYSYLRFRPQFILSSEGETFFEDLDRTQQVKEFRHTGAVLYPLDRFHRLEFAVSTRRSEEKLRGTVPLILEKTRDSPVYAAIVRDTSTGRYLNVISGSRLRLFFQRGTEFLGGDQKYFSYGMDANSFLPYNQDSILALRFAGRLSAGPERQLFRLGGWDMMRGFPRGTASQINSHSRTVMMNMEWRQRLIYMNANTWFIFPDLMLKALYGHVFFDTGYGWDTKDQFKQANISDIESSAGLALNVPAFILQTFPIELSLQIAKRLTDGRVIWYFVIGPVF